MLTAELSEQSLLNLAHARRDRLPHLWCRIGGSAVVVVATRRGGGKAVAAVAASSWWRLRRRGYASWLRCLLGIRTVAAKLVEAGRNHPTGRCFLAGTALTCWSYLLLRALETVVGVGTEAYAVAVLRAAIAEL